MSATVTEPTTTAPANPPRRNWLRIFTMIALILATAAGVFAAVVAMKPDDYRVVRSATFQAPAAVVFDSVNDFHNWEAWSPWAKLDPNAKNTFEGSPAGAGAVFAWDGNDKVGAGRLTILESLPHEYIRMKLEFIRPMEDSCLTDFTFQPSGDQTLVSWSMSGKHPSFIGKAFCTLMNMEKMIGTDFEKGLANMKTVIEKAP
jgi:hypothetical protein